MKRLKWYLDDIVFQTGMPCRRYMPHMHKHRPALPESHVLQKEFLYAAVDNIFEADSPEEVLWCMRYIRIACSGMLRYGSHKLKVMEKKGKDGVKNG